MTSRPGPDGEPTLADVEREFPGWECYESFGWAWARLRTDPDTRVRGEDPMDLRDQIIRHISEQDISEQDLKAWRAAQAPEPSAWDSTARAQADLPGSTSR
jgi:hypothetical protein